MTSEQIQLLINVNVQEQARVLNGNFPDKIFRLRALREAQSALYRQRDAPREDRTMNTLEALRGLLATIEELDTRVFEAALDEPLELKLRRHLEQMGDLVTDELHVMEKAKLLRFC